MLISLVSEHESFKAGDRIAMGREVSGWVWPCHVTIVKLHHVEVNYEARIKTYTVTMTRKIGDELHFWGVL